MSTIRVYIDRDLEKEKQSVLLEVGRYLESGEPSTFEIKFRNCPLDSEIINLADSLKWFKLEWEVGRIKFWLLSDGTRNIRWFVAKPNVIESIFDVDWMYEAVISDYKWWVAPEMGI